MNYLLDRSNSLDIWLTFLGLFRVQMINLFYHNFLLFYPANVCSRCWLSVKERDPLHDVVLDGWVNASIHGTQAPTPSRTPSSTFSGRTTTLGRVRTPGRPTWWRCTRRGGESSCIRTSSVASTSAGLNTWWRSATTLCGSLCRDTVRSMYHPTQPSCTTTASASSVETTASSLHLS